MDNNNIDNTDEDRFIQPTFCHSTGGTDGINNGNQVLKEAVLVNHYTLYQGDEFGNTKWD